MSTSSPVNATIPGLPLTRGASGEAVRDLQHRLKARGLHVEPHEFGVFGTSTEAAVRAFQQEQGLIGSGRCDEATWAALVEAAYRLGDRLLYLRRPMQRGDDVAQLQRRLSSIGFDAGRVDGIFGPDSERAVRDFQRNAGLADDGIFGPDTQRALDRLGNRVEQDVTVAGVRERERLRGRPATLSGYRLAVGTAPGLGALARAVQHELTERGAHVVLLEHPDPSHQAQEANGFHADVFIGLSMAADEPSCVCFYRTAGFESLGGHGLADAVVAALSEAVAPVAHGARGMRLPILRETRMPAVVCLLDDPVAVVAHAAEIAAALRRAVERWLTDPGTAAG